MALKGPLLARPVWPGWTHLPREQRDTLFVLALIGWILLPHTDHLPLWCSVMSATVLIWRAGLVLSDAPLPSRWTLIAVLVGAVVLTWWSHRSLFGREAGVTLLVVLMALKTLELRARRDANVVFFLGFFIVLTHFLFSQSLLVAAAMLIAVWGLLTALVLAHLPVGKPRLLEAGAIAARAAAWGTPVMVVLFLLFPRIGPLWALPQDAHARSGLSSTLTMGSVADLALDERIAFRARFNGPPPPPELLYWRGPVLTRFDGRQWQRGEVARHGDASVRGSPLNYEMTIEPLHQPWLPLLEASPLSAAPQIEGQVAVLRGDGQWVTTQALHERVRFHAQAWPQFERGRVEDARTLAEALTLPINFNPRMLVWVTEFRAQPALVDADAAALVRALLEHIRQSPFHYTLSPGTYGDANGRHAIDEFWLDRRRGFCEHFASAFVVAMRAMGVPARIVTGYQGADTDLQDGWVVVRQAQAHAWTEVWIAGRGWVRVDPTAAVAPSRVERGEALRAPSGLIGGTLRTLSPALMRNLQVGWERLNNQWNQWVLTYSRTQQFELLRNLGVSKPSWEDLGFLLLALVVSAATLGAAWALWDRHHQDPWLRLHRAIRRQLAVLGVASEPHHGLQALASTAHATLGPAGDGVTQRLLALDRLRYGPDATRKISTRRWRREFTAHLRQFRQTR